MYLYLAKLCFLRQPFRNMRYVLNNSEYAFLFVIAMLRYIYI